MTVGFYSPLPPAETGVADYAAALLAELRKRAEVRVGGGGDIALYHLGNNSLHRAIYQKALERPGLAVLHDAVLHHFYLGALSRDEYEAEFAYNYGAWAGAQARELWRARARSASDPRYFRHPMLRRIAERSLGVVVHNPAAAAMVKAHAPGARVFEIPHLALAAAAPEPWRVERLRARLGVPAGAFVFGVFGHLRESKRLAGVLRAFDTARQRAQCALLVAGGFASRDLKAALEPALKAAGVLRLPALPEGEFAEAAALADAAINLRYPAAGETSGIAIRLMGLGKPVILTRGPEVARWAASECVAIDSGPAEEEMLAAVMLWLARHRSDAELIGARAAARIRQDHDPGRAAGLYLKALADCYHRN